MRRIFVSRASSTLSALAFQRAFASTRLFTESHEWVDVDSASGVATVGITNHAQEHLGDVIFVHLPELGASFERGDMACEVESVKAVGSVYTPVSGAVTEANTKVAETPKLINESAEENGWLFKIKMAGTAPTDLMDAAAYKEFLSKTS